MHTGFISYRLSKTTYQFPYVNMGREFTAEYDRPHELKIMNNLQWRKWNFGCTYSLTSGKLYPGSYKVLAYHCNSYVVMNHPVRWDLNNLKRTAPFHSLDLNVSKKMTFGTRFEFLVGANVYNLFNRKYELAKYNELKVIGNPSYPETSNSEFAAFNDQFFTQNGVGRLFNVYVKVGF